ncbi:MAG TPA: lipoyl(octanoyl) transferase LipB [Terracidiphilus sp.]|nr:lipoyl(octanoyl) transferase LipB [Terracidiphilus sp.]
MIQYLYLGRVDYAEALALQTEIAALRLQNRVANTLLLLEHPPVLTLGRNANRANVLASDELLAARGITLHAINRGGDVTYHGPGQLIGYPIFDLRSLTNAQGSRLGPVDFVRRMEEALIRLCGVYGLRAGRIAGLTGVWCGVDPPQIPSKDARKIAAIGIHVARGITTHGFAFNLDPDLRDFQLINPCGITDKPVTSLAAELAREGQSPAMLPTLEQFAHQTARQFGLVFGRQILAVGSLNELRAHASSEPAAPQVPAPPMPEDTPLEFPRDLDRLRSPGNPRNPFDPPVRA